MSKHEYEEEDIDQIKSLAKMDKQLFDARCEDFRYTPVVIDIEKNQRIIAIGDLHGDIQLTRQCLKASKVIDDHNNWIGGNTIVVQIGDQLDGCRPYQTECQRDKSHLSDYTEGDDAQDVQIMKLMNKLNLESESTGGRVISLVGNHELMNTMGHLNYVSRNDLLPFRKPGLDIESDKASESGMKGREKAFTPGHDMAKFMACSMVSSVIVGPFLFVHAGFIEEFTKIMNITCRDDLIRCNYVVRKWLLGIIRPDGQYIRHILSDIDKSPFWIRIFGNIPRNVNIRDMDKRKCDSKDCKMCFKLLPTLELFGVKGMIIGHTPQFFGKNSQDDEDKIINSTCDNRLWRVDVGSSYAFEKFDKTDGHLRQAQVLEIDGNNMKVLQIMDNHVKVLKSETLS